MHRVMISSLAAAAALVAGCSPAPVLVEVLPPRTSVTCAAPDKSAAALGRGLLDATASLGAHGAYTADLRLSVKGRDATVDGVTIDYTLPDGSSATITSTAQDVDGDIVVGDTVLFGEDEKVRTALIENVQLVPRELSVALQDDEGLGLSKVDFATIGVSITPIVTGTDVVGAASTFAIDVCKGCLVLPPDVCAGDGEFALIPVACRPGQDTPLFTCVGGV
jgi:hypothetical protein